MGMIMTGTNFGLNSREVEVEVFEDVVEVLVGVEAVDHLLEGHNIVFWSQDYRPRVVGKT